MLSVAEARARILAGLRPTPAEVVAVSEAWGRVAAEPVRARVTQPPCDQSAMDGYAVRSAEARPGVPLRVAGDAPAGRPFARPLGPGEAVRLFTGSVVPDGADAILLQEDADRAGDSVTAREAPQAGRYIRRGGQDFSCGEVVVAPGRLIGARDVGLIAAANVPWVAVHRRPRVALLSTGDELSLPGDPIGPGGIVSSNLHALAALVRAGGGEPMLLPLARDDAEAIAGTADKLASVDMLVTTGGASVGEHDLVRSALADRGFALDFWQVAMRPGKPLLYGRLGGVPVLGLPGNPVSSIVCAVMFLLPALERLLGRPGLGPPLVRAILGTPLPANDRRADHLRATLETTADGALVAYPFSAQDSGLLRRLATADALVLRPPHAPAAATGETVDIVRLDTLNL